MELAKHLSNGNENVRRGDVVAAIRDLAQVALSERGNAEDAERRLAAQCNDAALVARLWALVKRWRSLACDLAQCDDFSHLTQRDVTRLRSCADELDAALASRGAGASTATCGPSKWCAGDADAESHGWCANRSPEESHCGCPCHTLTHRNYETITAWLAGRRDVVLLGLPGPTGPGASLAADTKETSGDA